MSAPHFEFRAVQVAQSAPSLCAPSLYAAGGKRALDIALVILLAPVLLPIVGILAAAISISGGQPFYRQARIGQAGRRFRCWKLRTMHRDADARLARILADRPDLALEWAQRQKLARDPRITRLGRILRRSSLDELPQLWNVLLGDMSLVGPRPFTPEQEALYALDGRSSAYYALRPGITGLWQVARRNGGPFAERAAYDASYAADLSLAADLAILARTASVVARGTGQ